MKRKQYNFVKPINYKQDKFNLLSKSLNSIHKLYDPFSFRLILHVDEFIKYDILFNLKNN